jgi:hypothetical protein
VLLFQILLPSPRNHADAQMKLFEAVDSRAIVYGSSSRMGLEHVLEKANHIPWILVPELEQVLAADPEPPYESKVTYDNFTDAPFMFVHTSGTSGISLSATFGALLNIEQGIRSPLDTTTSLSVPLIPLIFCPLPTASQWLIRNFVTRTAYQLYLSFMYAVHRNTVPHKMLKANNN